ncbi:3-oxoacyl-ACP synthase III family protein [Rhodothermus profundi]|uniref:Biotin biosynthesis protein BioZ n=1 Tax=Rhodothermus profundi TaxID=633813 RepID=A0A1M6XT33_9BACT|nr:beta-ketoacyl-ACP synthase 3 [Rhodothermus profundi]SHL09141.1 biotin biosynthesis protein BioZ [Rhodothermus profundi]
MLPEVSFAERPLSQTPAPVDLRAAVLGVGAALPARRETSAETERRLGLPAGWIVRRTGIRERPMVRPDEATSDLAVRAGAAALQQANLPPETIRLLLLATSTPDHLLPPTAPIVAHRLGLTRAGAIDLAGACSGFLYALTLADSYVRLQQTHVLVVGANVLSRRINPNDPRTSALFADGAGAVVLGPVHASRGIVASWLGADGASWQDLYIPAGGSRLPLTPERVARGEHLMHLQNGPALFRKAAAGMAEAGRRVLAQAGLTLADVAWWIPHQANHRLIEEARRQLGIPASRTINVVERIGNSSAATIPLALALEAHRFQRGDLLLLTAVGAGLLSAAILLQW